jgi:glutaredoxin
MADVVIYGRPECCLCDDALEVLQRVRARLPFVLREQNIEQDEALLRRYLERIPVVTIDGVEAFELFVDEAEFARQVSGSDGRDAASRVSRG